MNWPKLFLVLALGGSGLWLCRGADEIRYEQLKGDALKAVLKPLPPKEPPEALRCLEVVAGFSVEYVAHEPLVLDPVAAAIDENGLMYVAEDADYPYRPEPGEPAKGRIRLLKDNDGDGFYEESRLFAQGLLWPAGVAPWKGGVFVTAPPDVWYLKDTNGDGVADVREKVYTGFGTGGSQYIMNNLQWGLDHRIYAAVAGNGGSVQRADRTNETAVSVSRRDFRFDPVTRDFESISGGKQFGNTFDDWGNRFLCTQDAPVYQAVFAQRYLNRNPLLAGPESTPRLVPAGEPVFRTSPIEAWRAVRSSRRLLVQKGSPNDSGVSHHVLDGVAGSTVYRGGAFPTEFYGNLFSGDAQNNLVHRRSLVPDGVLFRSERLDRGTEFLRSTDNWFRPVNFVNAPDGTLYVLDLAREVLEAVHIPMDVVSHLELTSGRDRGRIFRVKPKDYRRPPQPKPSEFTTGQWVSALESPHVWWRETAHRLLYERQDQSAARPLRRLLQGSALPQARLHALWSLAGLKALSVQDILAGLADPFPAVRENALRLAEMRLPQSDEILSRCLDLAADANARVRFQLALTLGEVFMRERANAPSTSEKSGSGSTGYQPVPSGNLPDGTGAASRNNPGAGLTATPAAIPVGRLPTGAGRLPAPPISQTGPDEVRVVRALAIIAKRDPADAFIRTAVLSSSYDCAARLLLELLQDVPFIQSTSARELFAELARIVGGRHRPDEVKPVLAAVLTKERCEVQQAALAGLADGLRRFGETLNAWVTSLDSSTVQRFDRLMDDAIRVLADRTAAPEQIAIALRLLENAESEKAVNPVLELLGRFPPSSVQVAAIRTLSRLNGPGWEAALLARWKKVTPEARRELLSALLAVNLVEADLQVRPTELKVPTHALSERKLSKKERIEALLTALERGQIMPGELDVGLRSSLLRHTETSIRRRATALWGEEKLGERSEVIKQYREALNLKGNSRAGQEIFQRLCSSCHRLNGVGSEVGPNLALASSRSPDELLTHILDPNRQVDPAYVQYAVETSDGEALSGLLVADSPASVTLKGVNFQSTVPRSQIKRISSDGLSLMPVGLEQGLGMRDVANLLSFLIEAQYDFGTSGHSYSRDEPERR